MNNNRYILLILLVILFLFIAPSVYSQVTFRLGGGITVPTSIIMGNDDVVAGSYYPCFTIGISYNFETGGSTGLDIVANFISDIQVHLEYVHEFFLYDFLTVGPIGSVGFTIMPYSDDIVAQGFGLKIGGQIAVTSDKINKFGLRVYTNISFGFGGNDIFFYLHFPIMVFLSIGF